MALWPNNRSDIIGRFPVYQVGYLALRQQNLPQRNVSYFGNESVVETSSIPEGTFESVANILPPIVAGGLSSSNNETDITLTGTSDLLSGGPMSGTGTLTLDATNASLSLITSMTGTGSITLSGDNVDLKLTVGLNGTGSITIDGTSSLAMIVPFEGTGSMTLTGVSDLRGLLSLAGDFNTLPEFSPEALASAVWDALTASYALPGSFGEAVVSGGGGTDWTITERNQIRYRLGIDGSTATPTATPTLAVQSDLAAVKAKTDQLSFAVANRVDVNVRLMNSAAVQGTGTAGDLWRG